MRDRQKESYRGKSPAMQRVEKMRKKQVQRERMMVERRCGGPGCSGVCCGAHAVREKRSNNVEPESSMVIETTFASDDIRVNGIS